MNRKNALNVWLIVAVASVVLTAGCRANLPLVTPEDAGDASFARQIVPIVEGRKVKGYDEVKLISDLIDLTDRQTVVRALMKQPDYVAHWSEVLVDDLRVHREDARSQSTCYGAPLRAGTPTGALAEGVMNSPPGVDLGSAFNMSDVLRSSLTLDNLYPTYAAHLYAMENRPGFDTERAMRDTVGSTFGQVYVHRELLCLSCHNSEFSLSGEASGWDRTHPIDGYFEKALYGTSTGIPADDAHAVFRTDVLAGGGAIEPWGLTGCGTFKTSVPVDPLGESAYFTGNLGQQASINTLRSKFGLGFLGLDANGLQRTLPADVAAQCDFCADSCSGSTLDVATVANSATNAATVKSLLTTTVWSGGSTCLDCHGGSAGLNLSTGTDWANELIGVTATELFNSGSMKRVDPGHANNSYKVKKIEGAAGIEPQRMPRNANPMTATQINQIKAWVNSMPELTACGVCATTNCAQPKRTVSGIEAFAFLTAANIADNVWAEAMGTPLTIANYFPRNHSEQQALWHLTEYQFIPQGWSPKAVLSRALTSNYFNRKAPQFSALTSPYAIPPLLDPWIEADPRVPPVSDPGYVAADHPENHLNAMGEGVYRYSANSLLNSVHKALDWPAPQRFPSTVGYANEDLQKAIGQYFTDTSPGFRGTDLQGLLFWESVHGACAKPSGVGVDWIDRVITAINAFSPADPGGPLSVQDVVTVLRDWLLGHGGVAISSPVDVSGDESSALAAMFGVASLNDNVSSVSGLPAKLRGLCGVLTETPQFMLAGIAPSGLGPEPRLRVCNGGACSYQQMCAELKPAIDEQLPSGSSLICGTDSVNILHLPRFDDWWVNLCFGPGCGLLIEFVPEGCYREVFDGGQVTNPIGADAAAGLSCPIGPPSCDVRCSGIDCCGGPLPPINQRKRALMVAYADGADVRAASNVKFRAEGKEGFEELRAGTQVHYGDLLALAPGAKLSLKRGDMVFKTPRAGLPKDIPDGLVFMSITGERARTESVVAEGLQRLPLDHVRRIQNGWASRGEGGAALSLEEFKQFRYSREELSRDKPASDDAKQ